MRDSNISQSKDCLPKTIIMIIIIILISITTIIIILINFVITIVNADDSNSHLKVGDAATGAGLVVRDRETSEATCSSSLLSWSGMVMSILMRMVMSVLMRMVIMGILFLTSAERTGGGLACSLGVTSRLGFYIDHQHMVKHVKIQLYLLTKM